MATGAEAKIEHTPGPWEGLRDHQFYFSIYARGTERVATASDLFADRGEANARLIASAPELLDALKYARRFLLGIDHDVDYVDGIIDKAEGRS